MGGLVHYPLKLRKDVWVYLRLPSDFTRDDAVRMSAWLETLVTGGKLNGESTQPVEPTTDATDTRPGYVAEPAVDP